MRRQKRKITGFLILAVVLSLTAYSGKTTETETQSESTTEAEFAGTIDVKTDWKATFEAVLMKERGVKPDHYEELGSGIYQVYVEKDGKVIPYAIVDSTTGEYHR